MKTWQTLIVSTLILVGAGTAVGVMVSKAPEPEKAEAEEPEWQVEAVTVEPGAHRPEIRLVGQLRAERQQSLTTPLASEVLSVTVREGSRVEAGDTLLTLDDFDTRQRLQQVEADLADIEARLQMQRLQHRLDKQALAVEETNLDRLKQRLKQQKMMVERGLASQQQVDDLQQQVDRQQLSVLQQRTTVDNHPAQLAQLNASLKKLQLNRTQAQREQAKTTVVAPFNGRIARVEVSQGKQTQPGQTLMTLYSDQSMQLEVSLPPSLAGREHLLNAELTRGGRHTALLFDRAEAVLGSSQSGVRAWFDLVDSEGWLPGGHARVTVSLPPVRSYRVPEEAVFQDGWIYLIDDNQRLQARSVDVLGVDYESDERWLIVRGPEMARPQRILTTRLNNPVTGMKVSQPGADPAAEEADSDAETAS